MKQSNRDGEVHWLPVALCLFCSGFCALIYQTTWLREFRLIFGASTAASAAVLAIFMGGLGAGSILLGKKVDRLGNPFRFYGKLELIITGSAALTPLLIWLARHTYIELGGTMALGTVLGTCLRLILATIVLLAPTFLMGGTLPAAVRAVQSESDSCRHRVALLYGVNALGAVTGTMFSTFFLFERLGNQLSLCLACLVNAGVALVAIRLAKNASLEERQVTLEKPNDSYDNTTEASPKVAAGQSRFVYVAAGVVGFVFFLMELVWYRMLSPLLGGSTFSFGLILAVALLGIALGSLLYSLRRSQRPITLGDFSLICGLEALFIALPYAMGDGLAILAAVLQPLGNIDFVARITQWSLITMIVVLPGSVLAGIQFPMLIALLGQGRNSVGSHTGYAYGWNTAGAITGSLAGGFGLMSALTAPGTWRWVVVLLCLLALSALCFSFRSHRRWCSWTPALSATALALLMLTATGPTAVWRHSPIGAGRVQWSDTSLNILRFHARELRRTLQWEAEGLESSVGLTGDDSGYAFVVNGKVDGNARADAQTQVMSGLLPALMHPKPRHALVVGLGTGSTAGWLGAVQSMERVDVVELEPAIKQVAQYCFPVNHGVLTNAKVHLYFGDAREVMLTTKQEYDLIFSEPSNPYRAGIASLYTQEYYEAAARRLRPDGLFAQWVQAYEVDGETISTIYATLCSVFAVVESWKTQTGDLLFIGGQSRVVYDIPLLRQRVQQEPYRSALAQVWRVTDLEGVFARYIAHRDLAQAVFASGVPINTDDRNRLEFAFARTVGRQTGFGTQQIYDLSREQKYDKPELKGGDLDWNKVEDRRASSAVVGPPAVIQTTSNDKGIRARVSAKSAFSKGDLPAAHHLWQSQPQEPGDLTELLLVAQGWASIGDDKAARYIDQLRTWLPNEADAVVANYLARKGQVDEAFNMAEKAFRAFQTDPWPDKKVIRELLEWTQVIIKTNNNPAQAARLYETLERPFAVHLLNRQRMIARLEIAKRLDTLQATRLSRDALQQFEPNAIWAHGFLEMRAEIYGQSAGSTARRSARDLVEFEANDARPFVYLTREEMHSRSKQFQDNAVFRIPWGSRAQAREK